MQTCPHCQFAANPDSVSVCQKCGLPLAPPTVAPLPLRRTRALYAPNSTSHLVARDKHVGKLGQHEVAIYFADAADPLIASVTHDVVLGRMSRVVSVTDAPAIDLTPYQAIERGVSRAHAALRRYDATLAVIDLASTNGTWLNGSRIPPSTPIQLNAGDRISLAKLSLYIYFD